MKPDISLATYTGHFNLLTTASRAIGGIKRFRNYCWPFADTAPAKPNRASGRVRLVCVWDFLICRVQDKQSRKRRPDERQENSDFMSPLADKGNSRTAAWDYSVGFASFLPSRFRVKIMFSISALEVIPFCSKT